MKISLKNTAVIAIDYQEKLVPAIDSQETVVKNSVVLLKGLKELGVPCIVTQQYPKGLGQTIPDISDATGNIKPYDKLDFSCYADGNIKSAVDALNKKDIIVCGIEAHVCVIQTAIDLRDAGYNVIMVEDCVGSRKNSDKQVALKRAAHEGIIMSSYESILFELTERAGSDVFKFISKLVK